jgi:glycosyltransferase involved in cell wall biosynthesis
VINETFESIKKQSLKNFEWIIVNDGSNKEGNNQEILSRIKNSKINFQKIRIINLKNNIGLPGNKKTIK